MQTGQRRGDQPLDGHHQIIWNMPTADLPPEIGPAVAPEVGSLYLRQSLPKRPGRSTSEPLGDGAYRGDGVLTLEVESIIAQHVPERFDLLGQGACRGRWTKD